MDKAAEIDEIVKTLAKVAEDPAAYATEWKARTQRKVFGILPMNFPAEIVHSAGALPTLLQEDDAPITYGRSLLHEFYCGYTRSLVDQAATGKLAAYDGIFLVDHCVALLGAVDAIRFELPEMPVFLAQFTASMDEPSARPQISGRIGELRQRLEELCGAQIEDAAIHRSITIYNRNRALLRHVYEMRRSGRIDLTGRQMQALVKSAMVMDIEDHTALMIRLIALLEALPAVPSGQVRLHVSGHFCHAPRPELFDMIESCGVTVVDDDIYTGYRFISTDVPDDLGPIAALTRWYFDRNNNVPCSTRAQKTADWESYLGRALEANGAQGVIVLMPKFCEPHMLYYPELRKEFHTRGIPHLLIETEHEGLALEMLKTRVEALVEIIRRPALAGEPA
ncbi:2-hydroxyacyl-CoA dehydratase subunit D [Paracoccus alkenifer]|uniref:2-hydroxyglutaryl-CoA dehydratase, D-component n=1 Tax=Paracoccus alkenifer TaxID=65735 RepID=A0A1H6NDP6_9RHOB|nr:2-hydroxyacyl-CoA dehydratase family protein [Paracoccus alkenifer]SEI13269.1 2-hydroxyglutaryl-CoA dehydratase, D-component [Paracoccus alkenifer]